MRKRIKTLVTVIAAAALMLLPPSISALNVSAATPSTFNIAYDSEKGGWYVQRDTVNSDGSDSEEETEPREMQFFYNTVKDGDLVVVSNAEEGAPLLDLGSVRLSNLTVLFDSSFTMIQAGSVQDFYGLAGCNCAVTAPITNAYLYDAGVVNFNSDVQNIISTSQETDFTSTVGCGGTVGSLKITLSDGSGYTLYSFARDSLRIENGTLLTSSDEYSTEPSAAASNPAPSTPSQPSSSRTASDDEYDKVPKTGEANTVVWLLCAGVLCMVLSCSLRKASKIE